ncbi:isopentenyl-diphosphate Delta-isomerase [Malassezia cuniculi]|uniref:isopentenyl-diphosphate Delta-isomerase n=1 Tax=Malassezia cuniculi TaxID=948313 RepID=A0AAF0ERW4_9BASI|nr:isopentenyl-diphosphate Delta-isomerase [Malassezia cuniculi]
MAQSNDANVSLAGFDDEQVRLMEERCIVVDDNDNILRDGSKKECHLMTNIRAGLLHRAFSCFIFHPDTGKLLLQKRAPEKITFPNMWTNTCCSHPLMVSAEIDGVAGAKRAAQRKLEHELGIPSSQVPIESFQYLTRIHYLAPSDGLWGEHEIDYILFVVADVTLDVNRNEVCDEQWVSPDELRKLMEENEPGAFTPWFKLIVSRFLFPWWNVLLESRSGDGPLDAHSLAHLEDSDIHRLL